MSFVVTERYRVLCEFDDWDEATAHSHLASADPEVRTIKRVVCEHCRQGWPVMLTVNSQTETPLTPKEYALTGPDQYCCKTTRLECEAAIGNTPRT